MPQTTTTIDPFLFTINPSTISTINFEPLREQIQTSTPTTATTTTVRPKRLRQSNK